MLWSHWLRFWQRFYWRNRAERIRHTKPMAKNFLIFGMLGWCAEILWTGFCALLVGDPALTAKTYLWMFPIYGSAALAAPLFLSLRRYCPAWQRGGVYILAIFAVEFISGALLHGLTGSCPWDYGEGLFSVMGYIRLDYAPLWAILGFFFERVCTVLAGEEGKRNRT